MATGEIAPGRCRLTRALAPRVRGDLQPGMQRQLLHDVANVTLDGVCRDLEPLGDFLIAQPLADERDHLALASRHADLVEGLRPLASDGRFRNLRKERLR